MPWKKKGDVLDMDASGNPVWVNEANQETSVQGDTISRLNGEAASNRKDKEKLQAQLDAFKDIDPVKARTALETVSKIDSKTLIDAGKVDEVKAELTKQFQAQLDAEKKTNADLSNKLTSTQLSNAFRGSKYIQDNMMLDADLTQKLFADRFGFDGEKMVAKDAAGNPIYSKKVMGEYADFDEAFEVIIGAYPGKDALIKGGNQGGTGNTKGGSTPNATGRVIKRADFDAMSPIEKSRTAKTEGVTFVD